MHNIAARSLIVSMRLYQALLAVYPSEFRRAYGAPMLQLFHDCSRRALHEAGTAGLLSLWGRTLLDTLQTALEQHSQRGVDMSKGKFIKLSGWALMLGGLALMLGWLASTRPEYLSFDTHALLIDRYINAAELPLIILGLLLLSVGFIGLVIRYGQGAGSFGRISLGLGALSGVVGAVGAAGLSFKDSNPWWSLFFFGTTIQFLGLALFGMTNLRRRTLPRWNGLPLLAGMWVPLFVLMGISIEIFTGSWVKLPEAFDIIQWLLGLGGLIGLGWLLQSDVPATNPVPG